MGFLGTRLVAEVSVALSHHSDRLWQGRQVEQAEHRITNITGISLPSHNASTFLHDLRLKIFSKLVHEIGSDIQESLVLWILTFSTAKCVKSLYWLICTSRTWCFSRARCFHPVSLWDVTTFRCGLGEAVFGCDEFYILPALIALLSTLPPISPQFNGGLAIMPDFYAITRATNYRAMLLSAEL